MKCTAYEANCKCSGRAIGRFNTRGFVLRTVIKNPNVPITTIVVVWQAAGKSVLLDLVEILSIPPLFFVIYRRIAVRYRSELTVNYGGSHDSRTEYSKQLDR